MARSRIWRRRASYGRYLLDTNIIIAILADEPQAKGSLAQAEQVFLPGIAIGELCYGARKQVASGIYLVRMEAGGFSAMTKMLLLK